jgi:hypothetical protein
MLPKVDDGVTTCGWAPSLSVRLCHASVREAIIARTAASAASRFGPRRQAETTTPSSTELIWRSPPIERHGPAQSSVGGPAKTSGGRASLRLPASETVTSTPPAGSVAIGAGQPSKGPPDGGGGQVTVNVVLVR